LGLPGYALRIHAVTGIAWQLTLFLHRFMYSGDLGTSHIKRTVWEHVNEQVRGASTLYWLCAKNIAACLQGIYKTIRGANYFEL
jgi:hypothetical protein